MENHGPLRIAGEEECRVGDAVVQKLEEQPFHRGLCLLSSVTSVEGSQRQPSQM